MAIGRITLKMMVIGLTGGIASGKSTVSELLSELGAVVLNADEMGHEILKPNSETQQEIVAAFGREILDPNDDIDRGKLGDIVFNDPHALARLNSIMHPRMFVVARDKLNELRRRGAEVVVLEAPLLIEANWTELVDQLWITVASEATVIRRLRDRSGLTEAQARARIHSQMPIEEKAKHADVVINTDCDFAEVKSQVEELWQKLQFLGKTAGSDYGPRLEQRIRKMLSRREKGSIPDKGLTPAAVLIPLYQKEGEYYVLFTKRTEKVEVHKGQLSFPGGAWDKGDENLLATAFRESFEEIGLRPEDIEILGELDDVETLVSNFVITPFVAAIPYPYEFKISQREVEELVEVPLSVFLDEHNFSEELLESRGETVVSYSYRYKDHVIWGATARILKQFLDLVFG